MKTCIQLILFTLLIATAGVVKSDDYGRVTVDYVADITDGDTFKATIVQWPPIIGHRIPVRIAHIDTPEFRAKCPAELALALRAKQFTAARLYRADHIELRKVKRGSFFRITAEVWVDGKSLGQMLMDASLAKPYSRTNPVDWCKE